MSMLDPTNYDEIELSRPIFDRQALRVTLLEVKEQISEKVANRLELSVKHALAQTAKSTDGREVNPGFQFTTKFDTILSANGVPLNKGQVEHNQISARPKKALILAGLRLPITTTGLTAILNEKGGWSALNGVEVVATVAIAYRQVKQPDGSYADNTSRQFQAVTGYAAVPDSIPASPGTVNAPF